MAVKGKKGPEPQTVENVVEPELVDLGEPIAVPSGEEVAGRESLELIDETGAAFDAPIDLAAKTLAGDLRDDFLKMIRELRDPWFKLGEKQQKYFAERVSDRCMALCSRAVRIVAAHDFPAIPATIKDTKVKDGIEAKLVLSRHDPNRHELLDATGAEVTLILADARAFMGARAAPHIDADEPGLPLEAEGGEGIGTLNDEDAPDDEALAAARELGAAAGRDGADGSQNPYPLGSLEREEWAAGWLVPEPGNNGPAHQGNGASAPA